MSLRVSTYLRVLRREWGFTQDELAGLVPRSRRGRVSDVERGLVPPNAGEILAYTRIFGLLPERLFPRYCEHLEEAVIRRAYRLHQRLERDTSPRGMRKKELLRGMLRSTPEPHHQRHV